MPNTSDPRSLSVLLVDDEVLVRRALAHYLQECGYFVIEAGLTDDALKVLTEAAEGVAAVLVKTDAVGTLSGPDLARWVQSERPEISVFVAGDVDTRAHAPGAICEEGSKVARHYDPAAVADAIRHQMAARKGS